MAIPEMEWYPLKPIPGGQPGKAFFSRLMKDPLWVCEAKLDGRRGIWDGKILWGRKGRFIPATSHVTSFLEGVPALDGEWFENAFWCFDLPDHGGPFEERRQALEALVAQIGCTHLHAMPRCTDWDAVRQNEWEGVVFKKLASKYKKALQHSKTTADWIKFRAEWE